MRPFPADEQLSERLPNRNFRVCLWNQLRRELFSEEPHPSIPLQILASGGARDPFAAGIHLEMHIAEGDQGSVRDGVPSQSQEQHRHRFPVLHRGIENASLATDLVATLANDTPVKLRVAKPDQGHGWLHRVGVVSEQIGSRKRLLKAGAD